VSLLRECKRQPWDLTARMVLADWMEEHGESAAERALAEFIRIGCPRGPQTGFPRESRYPTGREEELMARYGESWLGDLVGQGGWLCGRGLFELKVLADNLAADELDEPLLPEGWDWVERLVLVSLDRRNAREALRRPLLERVGVVSLGDQSNPRDVTWRGLGWVGKTARLNGLAVHLVGNSYAGALVGLLASEYLSNLHTLDLREAWIDIAGLDQVLSALRPGQLATLLLHHSWPGDGEPDSRWRSPALSELRCLDISKCGLDDDAVASLIGSPAMRNLRWLDLHGNVQVTASSVAVLCKAWPPLEGLRLSNTRIGSKGARLLAGCPGFSRLTWLNVENAGLDARGLRALLESPHLGNLRYFQPLDWPGRSKEDRALDRLLGQRFRGGED
jgi:uncharacterized protein (TIGR02996 family)